MVLGAWKPTRNQNLKDKRDNPWNLGYPEHFIVIYLFPLTDGSGSFWNPGKGWLQKFYVLLVTYNICWGLAIHTLFNLSFIVIFSNGLLFYLGIIRYIHSIIMAWWHHWKNWAIPHPVLYGKRDWSAQSLVSAGSLLKFANLYFKFNIWIQYLLFAHTKFQIFSRELAILIQPTLVWLCMDFLVMPIMPHLYYTQDRTWFDISKLSN